MAHKKLMVMLCFHIFVKLISPYRTRSSAVAVIADHTAVCKQQLVQFTKTRKLCYHKDDRAMRPIYRCPENFRESLTMSTPPCLQNF